MILIENTIFDDQSIAANLGAPEYSYYFVRRAFRHVLERYGAIRAIGDPGTEVDPIHAAANARGEECVFLSFNPPQYVPLGLSCPTIPVFAWEYDRIPDESWNANPQEDWRIVFAATGMAITHCQSAVDAVRRTMGADFPIWSIPAPIYDKTQGHRASARGVREATELAFEGAIVIDVGAIDVEMFREERVDLEGTRALRLLRRLSGQPEWRQGSFTIEGVVYVAVFNTADGRKNWYELIAAFVWAFRTAPDATLILKVTHADLLEGVLPLLVHISKLGDFACRILIVQGLLSTVAYTALLDASSYAVNSSHGEGQCLPLMEFMSAGRPAITPDHSAMADYVTPENSFVVGSDVLLASWPHDRRNAKRCLHHETDFAEMVRRYRESYRVARDEPERYARMSAAASAAQAPFCSDAVVATRFEEVLDHLRARGAFDAAIGTRARLSHNRLGLEDSKLDGWYHRAAGELVPGFPVSAEDVVLDAGCGEGGPAGFCAEFGAHLILTDVDAGRLEQARARLAGSAARKVETHLSAGDPLPIADDSVTRVLCNQVIEHVDDPRGFVRELARVGRPGARYLISVPGAPQERLLKAVGPGFYFEKPNHIHVFEPDAFRALVEEAGLEIERFTQEGFYWALWLAFWWQTGDSFEAAHPSLVAWTRTWTQVLAGPDGPRVKRALDAILPNRQVIVARKPAPKPRDGALRGLFRRLVGGRAETVPTLETAPAALALPQVDLPADLTDSYIVGLYDSTLAGWFDDEAGALVPGFPIAPDDVVLDVGCGEGGITAFCARRGAHVILADHDEARLGAAVERLRETPARRVDAHVSEAYPLPLPDRCANRVICTELLEHVDDPPALLAELGRVGTPGALYLITVPAQAQEELHRVLGDPRHFQKPNHIHVFDAPTLRRLVEDAGLVVERESADGFYWSIWLALRWQTGAQLGERHPMLDSWAETWLAVLRGPDGLKIKRALDALLPKRQVIVARKPG